MCSVRRGFQVYREVCASCHALEHTYFRNLVGVTHSEEEVKKIAEAYDIVDGPNAEGEMFERPGKVRPSFPPSLPPSLPASLSLFISLFLAYSIISLSSVSIFHIQT